MEQEDWLKNHYPKARTDVLIVQVLHIKVVDKFKKNAYSKRSGDIFKHNLCRHNHREHACIPSTNNDSMNGVFKGNNKTLKNFYERYEPVTQ